MPVLDATCLLCGPRPAVRLPAAHASNHVLCVSCGLVYQHPRAAQTELKHYEFEFWKQDAVDQSRATSPTRNERAMAIVESAPRAIGASTRLLEIGCGPGEILAGLRELTGADIHGLEPSHLAAKVAAERLGNERVDRGLWPREYDKPFDVVVMSHVLEHLPDPVAALRSVRSCLAPGGHLYVDVPNMGDPPRKKKLSRWLSPEHIWYFSASSLALLANRAGFRIHAWVAGNSLRCWMYPGESVVARPLWPALPILGAVAAHELRYWPTRLASRVIERGTGR